MTNSRKCQLLIALFVVSICLPALGKEQKKEETKLKFETSSRVKRWVIGLKSDKRGGYDEEHGQGPLKPTHMAEVFIWNMPKERQQERNRNRYDEISDFKNPGVIVSILDTPGGKSMSQQQKDLLTTGKAICRIGLFGKKVGNHHHFGLYAVSKDDAEKMTEAFVDLLMQTAANNRNYWLTKTEKLEKEIASLKESLSKEQAKTDDASLKLKGVNQDSRFLSSKEARKTILKLNKELYEIEIEVARQESRVSEIEKYLSNKKITSNQTLGKLQNLLADYVVQLADALGRKKAMVSIRQKAQEYYQIHISAGNVHNLKKQLSDAEKNLYKAQKELNEPPMISPKVFQNKVMIYPVRVEDEQKTGSEENK